MIVLSNIEKKPKIYKESLKILDCQVSLKNNVGETTIIVFKLFSRARVIKKRKGEKKHDIGIKPDM